MKNSKKVLLTIMVVTLLLLGVAGISNKHEVDTLAIKGGWGSPLMETIDGEI